MKNLIKLLILFISYAVYPQADFPEGINLAGETANTIISLNSVKDVKSLSTATYPSLTELSYVKGVTSSIQSQLDIAPFKRVASFGLQSDFVYYLGNTAEVAREARLYINKPAVLVNSGDHGFGDYTTVTQTAGGSGAAAWGSFDSRAVMNGADPFGHLISFQARNVYNGSAAMSYFAGIEATLFHTGSGNVLAGYGLHVNPKSGSGTFTDIYGLKIENQTGGTNNWGIVTGLGKNFLGDDLQIAGRAILAGKSELISGQDKTVAVSNQYSYFGKTNEASNYAALSLTQIGGATQTVRQWRYQTIEQGVSNEGAISYQAAGGRILFGTASDNLTDKVQVTGNIAASAAPTAPTHVTNKTYVDNADALKAPIASPTFTGSVTAPNLTITGPSPIVQFTAGLSTTTGIATAISSVGNFVAVVGSGSSTSYAILFDNSLLTSANRTLTAPDVSGVIAVNLSGSASLDFPSTAASAESNLTIAVSGAVVGDVISLGSPVWASSTTYSAYVSAPGTVTVRFRNFSVSAVDPAAATFKIKIFK